ncbi:MAG: kynureninase [Flaviaesturariibacter sp.]|nr:kynureninase [Flaviaesturariibacter sp.]
MTFENSLEYARAQDRIDPLRAFRGQFHLPHRGGRELIYFTGNSLGLQPRATREMIGRELDDWAEHGVEGHFSARSPWYSYHEIFPQQLAHVVGALPEEVVAMNQLTVNLHVLLTTFYRPDRKRYKIICEAKAFPSDQYAMESQVRLHGLDPQDAIVEVAPRAGEHTIRTEDITAVIQLHSSSVAVVLFGGVNYYTGQVFDMKAITAAGQQAGAFVGFDLAHAAGNVPLDLHGWNVDFACWCSYKYLNSGPGGVAGAFIHERHIANPSLPRMAGWWGYTKASRFEMKSGFVPIPTAEGWQMSNAPVLSMAAHKAALNLFEQAGMQALAEKSRLLTRYLFYLLDCINTDQGHTAIEVITPRGDGEHGCQVSMLMKERGREVFAALAAAGVLADWREPNVIRIAPVPLYNTFEEVWQFGHLISSILSTPGAQAPSI